MTAGTTRDGRRTGIVIVNYNSASHLEACLEALRTEPYEQVFVWDNASTDVDARSLRELCARYPRVVLHESTENLGFGPGVNRAVARLRAAVEIDYVWVLNPDVVVRSGALAALVEGASANASDVTSPLVLTSRGGADEVPVIWYAGGVLKPRAGRSVHTRIGQPVRSDEVGFRTVSFVSGAAVLFRREAWDKLGGFDESLFLYCEDAELSLRAAALGLSLGVHLDAVVHHWEGASSGSTGPGPTFYYYVQRNRLRVYAGSATRLQLLVGRGLGETARLLLLPFRPLNSRSLTSFAASVRGLIAGLAGETGPRRAATPSRAGRMRIYDEARTTHLERLPDDGSVAFVYRKASYDFNEPLARAKGARRLGRVGTAREIIRRRPSQLELNEPAHVAAWPGLAMYLASAAALRLTSRRPEVLAYAIENGDPVGAVSAKFRLPRRLASIVVRASLSSFYVGFTRIAFGTPGSMAVYRELLGSTVLDRVAHTSVPSLEPRCFCRGLDVVEAGRVLFLGSFESRKGLPQLLSAWSTAFESDGSLRLTLVGKGPLTGDVQAWARERPEVMVHVDPTRDEVHAELARASVLVLLSQRTPTWREQIGLPVLEALSHGCTVITSSETGLAPWLREHGHSVLDADVSAVRFGAEIAERAGNPLEPAAVLASLPRDGGRSQVDAWLARPGGTTR